MLALIVSDASHILPGNSTDEGEREAVHERLVSIFLECNALSRSDVNELLFPLSLRR